VSADGNDRVPFLDLGRETEALRAGLDDAWRRVLDRGYFILGPELEAFEAEFATFSGKPHAVGVASGLAALELILKGSGIGPGDEVIVPANTYIATWVAVSNVGATPVAVEPHPVTRNIDPKKVPAAVTDRTRAILTVHLYGLPSDMASLRAVADEHGLRLFVDAAQSAGAAIGGDRSVTHGDAAAFSFYPTKNLGALADSGGVVTGDTDLADRIRLLRNYGMRSRTDHPLIGTNARMGEIQAGILREKLKHLEGWKAERVRKAEIYRQRLEGTPALSLLPEAPAGFDPCWHLYVIQHERRDALRAGLAERGIDTAIHYPVPPHLSQAYRGRSFPALPVTEELACTALSLPFSPYHTDEEIERVCDAIRSWSNQG
jgi:dTDP-4-amino-4,6-dideoxygalactose transaminase